MFYILPRVISDDIPKFCNAQDLYWEGKQTLENCVAEKRRYDAFLQVYIVCCADITYSADLWHLPRGRSPEICTVCNSVTWKNQK